MLKDISSAVAIVLTFAIFVPYIRSIFREQSRPHVFSWLIWALGTLVVFCAQLAGNGGVGAWPIGVSAAITSYVALLAYLKRGDTTISRADWAFFATALAALPCWYLTSDPVWAVAVLTMVDLVGFGPTITRVYLRPYEERAGFFALVAVRNALVLLALEHYSLTTYLFPAAVGLACVLLAAFILLRRASIVSATREPRGPPW